MKKTRADEIVARLDGVESRSQARLLIMAGKVRHRGSIVQKAGDLFPEDTLLELEQPPKYVGRGGQKLEGALASFGLDPNGLVCVDIGASTGGFTDCLLQNGATKVCCVDVGTAQLAPKITNDQRVVVMDRTNARYLTPDRFDPKPQAAVVDVSFITGDKVIAPLKEILAQPAWVIWLLKPQFEAGQGKVGKGGIIRKDEYLFEAVRDALTRVTTISCQIRGIIPSPIKGADGNREYLVWLDFSGSNGLSLDEAISRLRQPSP